MRSTLFLAATLWLLVTMSVHAQPEPQRVLLLLSYDPLFPTSHLIIDTVRQTLEQESKRPLQLYVEFLYSKHNNQPAYLKQALELLRQRRSLSTYDLIMTVDDNALRLVHDHARTQFPNTPVVFLGVNDAELIRLVRGDGGFTGQFEGLPAAEFMAWYRSLFLQQPLRVLVDGRPTGQADLEQIQVAARSVGIPLKLLSLEQLSWQQLQQQLANSNHPLLVVSAYRDRLEHDKSFAESLRFVATATAAPLLHMYAHGIGDGMLGGVVVDHQQHAQLAARQALAILSGQSANGTAVNWQTPQRLLVDLPLFQKYGLNTSVMPAHIEWLNNPQQRWQALNRWLLAASLLALLLLLPLAWLGWQWQRSRLIAADSLKQQQQLRQSLDALDDLVYVKDQDGHYRFCNLAAGQFLGRDTEQLLGRTDLQLFSAAQAQQFRQFDTDVMSGQQRITLDEWVQDASGRLTLLQTTKTPWLNDSGQPCGVIGVARDVTELRKSQQDLEHMAHHDGLTGLPNRTLLQQRLTYALQLANRNGEQVAVIYIDLDRFKEINDTLGHAIGDLLLKDVAQRLHNNVRESDICARLGGDEFVLVLTQLDDASHIQDKCQGLLQALAQPYSLQGHLLSVFASAGVSLFPQHGEQVDALLAHADTALNQAKTAGRNRCCLYEPAQDGGQHQRANLEQDLRQAIVQQQLSLVYQPQFRLGDSHPKRAEALLRWPHQIHGNIAPNDFIPLAETSGLMADIGLWTLEQACRQFLTWRQQGLTLEKIAVNVSALQIDGHFAARIEQILQSLQFQPEWLELEVTESVMMSTTTEVSQQVEALRQLGIDFAIDDFGTGYSSLSKIKSMPVRALKIDQSFIAGLSHDVSDYEIVRAIVLMAKSLDMLVIAEGVESATQVDTLQRLGCEWMQGYYFAHPMSGDEFLQHYRTR
ncbi:hypothetical protein GCM10011297_24400 [Bacterioplanes sanyensis]|uniref:EAL domain-containing protein n=1 Tax=Bacterioplanes sanyensis TaxID=1249553 RepID=UPI001673E126|nr:EAL domain-containing protein [Bacterioplanes sanyensis]GGY50649.1 hypothetical protein GCM10011297_24400 [Bacterioplanes sanyensis]